MDTTIITSDDARPSNDTGLVKLLTRILPAQDIVLRLVSIRDIVALSRTTKAFCGLVGLVERTQFNINKRLKRFFTDPKAFRALQAKHNIIITGTFALGFMSRKCLSSDLQEYDTGLLNRVLVQHGPNAEALKSFLIGEGYDLRGTKPFPNHSIMVRGNGLKYRYVAFIETDKSPFSWIGNANFTCDVNFVTWNKAYSVFAYQTFILHEGYLLKHVADTWTGADRTLKLWDNIGISIAPTSLQDTLSLETSTDPSSTISTSSMLRRRLIGDRRSWIIPLNTDGIEPPPFPDQSFDYAGFEVTLPTEHGDDGSATDESSPFNHYTIKTTILKSRVLRHQYAFADEARAEHRRFRDRTAMQLYALPNEQRPPGFAQIFAQRQNVGLYGIGDFVPPGGWIYHDDEILKMLEMRHPGAVRVIKRGE